MSLKILYRDCLDGRCAAEIARKHFMDQFHEIKAEFIPLDPGAKFPISKVDEGDDVVLLAFTPKDAIVLRNLRGKAASLFWYDHSPEAIEMNSQQAMHGISGVRNNTYCTSFLIARDVDSPTQSMQLMQWIDIFERRLIAMQDFYKTERLSLAMMTVFNSRPNSDLWKYLLWEDPATSMSKLSEIISAGKVICDTIDEAAKSETIERLIASAIENRKEKTHADQEGEEITEPTTEEAETKTESEAVQQKETEGTSVQTEEAGEGSERAEGDTAA
ncbi:MAG: hypothetical protein ACYS80_10765 [Planctomycetota bacterium]|jgi:hypothetical protein